VNNQLTIEFFNNIPIDQTEVSRVQTSAAQSRYWRGLWFWRKSIAGTWCSSNKK